MLQRADNLGTGLVVGVDGKVGVKHFVCLANRKRDGELVTSISRIEVILFQPGVDRLEGLKRRAEESRHLPYQIISL